MSAVDKLRGALAHIKKHPDGWDQRTWFYYLSLGGEENPSCKTSYCLAGWVAVLEGLAPPENNQEEWAVVPETGEAVDWFSSVSNAMRIEKFVTQKILDMHPNQTARLFAGGNKLEDLEGMIADLEAGGDLSNWVLVDAEGYYRAERMNRRPLANPGLIANLFR